MSTMTMRRESEGRGCAFGMVEFAGCIMVLAVLLALASLALPKVKWTAHAKAHDEFSQIEQCFDPGNVLQIWINSSGERHNCLIKLPDGKVGDAVIQWSCRQLQWIGVTAYFIGDAQLSTAIDVLRAKACIRIY